MTSGWIPKTTSNLGTSALEIKRGAGGLLAGWYLYNNTSAVLYVRLYQTVNPPTNADAPFFSLPIPAGGGANVFTDGGVAFGNGIWARCTTGVQDGDNSAPATNGMFATFFYQ